MALKTTYTDGGKTTEGFAHEHNDCGVRALAIAAAIPYSEAHGLLKAEGRRDRKGTKANWIISAMRKSGIQAEEITVRDPKLHWYGGNSYTNPTLAEIIRAHQTGRYLVIVNGHALAMIDGVIHDKGEIAGARSRVRMMYRVTPKTQETAQPQITQGQINELWERMNRLAAKL
jgi:hypothetical protein